MRCLAFEGAKKDFNIVFRWTHIRTNELEEKEDKTIIFRKGAKFHRKIGRYANNRRPKNKLRILKRQQVFVDKVFGAKRLDALTDIRICTYVRGFREILPNCKNYENSYQRNSHWGEVRCLREEGKSLKNSKQINK